MIRGCRPVNERISRGAGTGIEGAVLGERTTKTYAKAEHDRLGIVITQRPQPVEFFLACCVPERELHVNVVHEDIVYVVLEYGRFVDGLFGKISMLLLYVRTPRREMEAKRCDGSTYRKEASGKDIQ